MAMWEIKSAIRDAIDALDDVIRHAEAEDPDGDWPAIRETIAAVEAVRAQAAKLIPLHTELEAIIKRDDDEADRYADWLASGNHPRL